MNQSKTLGTISMAALAAGSILGLVALKAQPIISPPSPALDGPSLALPTIKLSAAGPILTRADGFAIEPDAQLTPGAILTTSAAVVSKPGYATSVRNVSFAVKSGRFAAYHITPQPGQHFEIDHLISLELGGSNDPANLWPEPYFGAWNAHDKDRLEDRLHTLVAGGKLDLPTAQAAIRSDWCAAYRRYCDPAGPADAGPQVTKGEDKLEN